MKSELNNKKTILIVEDNQILQELLSETLGKDLYQIIKTTSGEDAIKKIQSIQPDLILMDIMLSGSLDGLETIGKIRAIEKCERIPIIIISAKGQNQDIQKGKLAGAVDYMVKPFSPTRLLVRIEQLLN